MPAALNSDAVPFQLTRAEYGGLFNHLPKNTLGLTPADLHVDGLSARLKRVGVRPYESIADARRALAIVCGKRDTETRIGYYKRIRAFQFSDGDNTPVDAPVETMSPIPDKHRGIVEKIISEGGSIPEDVLADYPGLKSKNPKTVTTTEENPET